METRPVEPAYPHTTVELVARRRDAEGLWELILDGWRVAEHTQPGQFVNIRLPRSGSDPLLRRPMSVAFVVGDRFGVLVQSVGVGSNIITQAPLGETFDVLGPLGSTFPPPVRGSRVAFVGGGVGVAPLRFAFERFAEWCGAEVLVGARSEPLLPFRGYFEGTGQARLSTDDGSVGLKGTVLDLLQARHQAQPFERVYTCGPPRMMEGVGAFCARQGIECYASLEARMACAMGQCLGCVVPKRDGGYVRVCTEGPVFDAWDIRLDADLGWSRGR